MCYFDRFALWAALFLIAASSSAFAAEKKLVTLAESTGWKQTGRYEEAAKLCHAFEKSYPKYVRCVKFGTTPEGRDMLALVATESGAFKPQQASVRHIPVLLAQGAIHAGECDGKDAGFYLLRELLDQHVLPGVLKKVVFVFVPIFNIDGHERFGAHNRPNQRGPEEMGWRVTARNFNLNRDYVKAETPEMQAMLGLLNAWDPIVYADLHVTDGAEFQHDIAVIVDPRLAGPTELRTDAAALSAGIMARLKELKHLPLPFYPDFEVDDDPMSGFKADVSPPRYSDAYWGDRNRFGVLVETHSWKDYATRVHATVDTLSYLLEATAHDGARWAQSARAADRDASHLAGQTVALTYEPTGPSHPIDFLGYEYTREKSDISGGTVTIYDPSKPKTLSVPFSEEVRPKLSVKAPVQGYFVQAADAPWVEAKLKLHALTYQKIAKTETRDVQVFRCTEPEFSNHSFEGRQQLEVKGEWTPERRQLLAGSLFVPIAQPRSGLLMQLLEPQAPDSLLSWGFFNSAFERKEYMEAYVEEAVAREMLAKEPAVRAEFEKKLASDAVFAKDPAKRLEFFYRKHPSWDERFGLYPVFRF